MKVDVVVGALLATALSPVFGHEDHQHHHGGNHNGHNSLRPRTHLAFHHVESACAVDVEMLCSVKQQQGLPQTLNDPILDWILFPFAPPPPELEDMSILMDRMVNSFMNAPVTQVSVFWYEEPQQAPHFMVDSMAAKLAAEKQPEEIPQLAHQLQSYGKQMLKDTLEDDFGQRIARRLTEIDAKSIQHNLHLPFGCARNRCMREAFEKNRLSEKCATSIRQLETTYHLEAEMERREDLFAWMMCLYIWVFCLLLFLLARKYRSQHKMRLMRRRILQAVYSNPAVKRQVEEELGEPLGKVPPLPHHVLRMARAGGKDFKRRLRCMKRIHMLYFIALFTLVCVDPFWVLPVCILASLVRVVLLCLSPTRYVDEDCECCCCGASAEAAKAGLLTEAQMCCDCCKGTGVCAPSCASCCACSCCGCCDGSCNCLEKKIEDECSCCCCGASAEAAKAGLLTEAQMCCDCCKGTGVCAPSCTSCCACSCCGCTDGSCSCCVSEKKGAGRKHVILAKHEIYEGVPLQVV